MSEIPQPFAHPVSEAAAAQLDLARRLSALFTNAGYELYLVGGAVREALLGATSDEMDFATSSPPEQTAQLLATFGSRAPYRIGEKFGTIGSVLEGHQVEVTTYRSRELYPRGSRKPQVEFGRTIQDDLSRRDFTINAVAFDPLTGSVIDPFAGAEDLQHRILRTVGDPDQRFREDPLRLLRGVRFAARFKLAIEPSTRMAMENNGEALSLISRERVRDEYSRFLTGASPSSALTLLRDFGLLGHSVPQLVTLTTMADHGANHFLSLWDHTMLVVDAVPPLLKLRWAALLHDIAKPTTRSTEPSGRIRFFHHESVGAEMARDVLISLRYPAQFVEEVRVLVDTHMQIHAYSDQWSDGAVRRLCLRLGDSVPEAISLGRADAAGHSLDGLSLNGAKFDELQRRLTQLDSNQVRALTSPLTGDDLMRRYGWPAGPWIREIKERLLNEVLDGTLRGDDTDAAWEIADHLMADRC